MLIIAHLIPICCLIDIGINPLCIDKMRLMKHRFVKRAFLKTATDKSCCPKNSLVQTALHNPCINED